MPNLKVNAKLKPLMTKNKPIKVAIGGRNSGKSVGFGDIFTMKMDTEKADIYCLREFQDSITDSVHRVFQGSVKRRLQLDGWEVTKDRVQAPNGAVTRYKGASRSPDSIQSAEGYKYSWFEEAHTMSQESIDKLLPTILRNPGSECWFSANPQSSADPFSQRFIVPYQKQLDRDGYYEDDLHLIVVINWRDNPWFGEEGEALRSWDYNNLPRAKYNWIWEGKYNDAVDDSIIMPEWVDAAVDAHLKIKGMDRGVKAMGFDPADEGSDDKAVAVRNGVVITKAEAWGEGDLSDAIDKAFQIAYDERCTNLVYDSVGIGAGVKVGLDDRLGNYAMAVEGFSGGATPEYADKKYKGDIMHGDLFSNKRAQAYWLLRDRFENTYNAVEKGVYSDPAEMVSIDSTIKGLAQLKSELVRVPRKRTANNTFVQILSKPEMKNRKIPSPNLADAVMMCFANKEIKHKSKYTDWGENING